MYPSHVKAFRGGTIVRQDAVHGRVVREAFGFSICLKTFLVKPLVNALFPITLEV